MSSIALTPNAAGTAIFTVAAPGTSTDRTLTLPNQTGTLATSADVTAAAAAVEGMVVLGDLASGNSYTLSGLNLTAYKQLLFDFNGISHNSGAGQNYSIGAAVVITGATSGDLIYGNVWVSLFSGVAVPSTNRSNTLPSGISGAIQIAQTGYSNATTSIALTVSAGAFDAGSVRVYGVK